MAEAALEAAGTTDEGLAATLDLEIEAADWLGARRWKATGLTGLLTLAAMRVNAGGTLSRAIEN
jgi:hypothetical protein